jgi:predicted ATPase/DNA-binding winged helix-turn-helix (wHTH) protein
MHSVSETPIAIDFGRFRVLPHRRELLADSRPVELGGRAFDVLMALIEARGAVVSKEMLMERVWPGRIVEENNLPVQITVLRKAFGADRDLIHTVSGRGYQFGGEIRTVSTSPDALPVVTMPIPLPPSTSAPTNLPESVSELIGREVELDEILGIAGSHRLVTLVGAGGIGKTRLGIEVARHLLPRFAEGVWVAELGPLSDPTLVPVTVATALGIDLAAGAVSAQRVASALRSKQLMLVLDNCEHMADAAASMAEALLRANPAARILATSREPLRVEGEWIYLVPPLAVPTEGNSESADLLGYGAIRLFIERVRAAEPHFSPNERAVAAIAAICRRLDGIPLAIELAAARVAALGIEQLAARLDDRFNLLAGGRRTALPRQQTLRATLDWSYELLTEPERAVLRHLSVFAGSLTLEAASQVAASGGISEASVIEYVGNLVDKSLITADVSGPVARYRLLETTRAYALEKLTKSGEHGDVARRHAEYYRNLFQRAAAKSETRSGAEWLAVYGLDIDNVRAALDWAFSPGGDVTIGVALTVASERLWFGLSLMDECRRRVEHVLSILQPASLQRGVSGSTGHEMQLYATLAVALFNTKGAGPEAGAAWTDVLEIAELLDDTEYRLRALWGLWYNHISNGECRAALTLAQRYHTLPPNQSERADLPVGERMLGTSLYYLGDLSSARHHLEHMLIHCTTPIRRSHMIRFQFDLPVAARGTLARVLWLQGFPDQAMRMAKDNVEDARAIDHVVSVSLYWALDAACMVGLAVGDQATAERSLAMLLEHSAKHALGFWQALGHSYEGQLLIKRGDVVTGVRCLRTGLDELREARYVLRSPGLLGELAEGMAGAGQVTQALVTIDEALAQCECSDERWSMAELLRIRGELLLLEGASEASAAAENHYQQGLDWARRQGALSWELRCATSLARLSRDQGRSADARALLQPVCDRFTEGFMTADLKAAKALLDELS